VIRRSPAPPMAPSGHQGKASSPALSAGSRLGKRTSPGGATTGVMRRYRTFDLAGVGGLKFLTSNGFVLAGVVRITQLGQGVSLNSAGGAKRNHAFALAIP